MTLMAQDLLAREMRGAALWVLRDNEPARRFYEALGARVVGQRVETVDAFIMRRAQSDAGRAARGRLWLARSFGPGTALMAGRSSHGSRRRCCSR